MWNMTKQMIRRRLLSTHTHLLESAAGFGESIVLGVLSHAHFAGCGVRLRARILSMQLPCHHPRAMPKNTLEIR